jgi:uncharacterized protein (DUF2141 family)
MSAIQYRKYALWAGLTLLVLGAVGFAEGGAWADGGTVRVQVSGFRNGAGDLGCALFAGAQGFPGSDVAVAKEKTAVTLPTSECVFRDVKPGRYAVTVLHDENRNGKMDKVWLLGIPLEGYGVSNNKTYATRGPNFEEAAFALEGPAELLLKVVLRY